MCYICDIPVNRAFERILFADALVLSVFYFCSSKKKKKNSVSFRDRIICWSSVALFNFEVISITRYSLAIFAQKYHLSKAKVIRRKLI